jgi:hypothetical protein
MSYHPRHAGLMKLTNFLWLVLAPFEIIARFGSAKVVRNLDGRHELIGGTPEEYYAAHEWCSLFAPEIVFSLVAQPSRYQTGRSLGARGSFAA